MVPPLNATDAAAATGVKVGAPQPLVLAAGTAATTMAPGLVGNVSLKATPVSTVDAFGLVSVKVSVETCPAPIGPENAFAIVGAATTSSVPLPAALLEPALAEVTAPAAIVFTYEFALAAATFTVTLHDPLAATVAPLKATFAPLAAAVTLPPAQLVAPAGAAVFSSPAG